MTDQWGPTGVAKEVNKHNLRIPEQPAYQFRVDRPDCCGCVVHSGAETSNCECRCHEAARLAAKPQFVVEKKR